MHYSHHTTALNAEKEENGTNCRFEIFLCVCSNCDVTIRQNHFAGVALFLAGGDRVGYFLNRPRTDILAKVSYTQWTNKTPG